MSHNGYVDAEDGNQNSAHRVILSSTKDSGDQQLLSYKGLHGEEHTDVVRLQYFGLSTHAPAGSQGVVVAMGDRDMPVVVGVESPKHRPTNLPEGGSRLYDSNGSYVDLDAAGNITAVSAASITIKTPKLKIEADIEIIGNITQTGNFTQSGVHVDDNGPHTA